ncbi:GntR family transcriptional regulator [Cohnella luojiensis]|uniref:GntR family transcriptional regulator n=1 Tax=Cohnella luojiensis TaxID=652876 RepID=A0A4Y8LW10_9BACL|nr:GntR family transcriptional regulator [Cohnella luojiensis]TFE25372.1 GntR family transcriptional regulator [Cohnella luojiensis]
MDWSSQQPGSAGNVVYSRLKHQILTLELPPGTVLSEKEMSMVFQMSRTPVRESFVRLAQEGLVLVLPQRGTKVSLIDSELVEEGRFMREQLERAVIRLACEHFPEEMLIALDTNLAMQQESMEKRDDQRMFDLDEAFHRTLFEGCRKLGTWAVIQQMNSHLNRSRMLWLSTDQHWNPLYEQHKEMVEAIRRRDPNHAERVMKMHLNLSISNMEVLKEKYPNYIK